MEFLISEQIFDIHKKIESNELVEHDMEYHKEIAEALKNDYYLAFDCFASCSVEFENNTAKVTIEGSGKFEGLCWKALSVECLEE